MRPFRYAQAPDAATAVATLAASPGAAFLAGGTNLVDLMKLGVVAPVPWRVGAAEAAMRGRPATAATFGDAADAELAAARPPQGQRLQDAAGRIVNAVTARSQLIGAMTMGLSMALHEESTMDPSVGDFPNHDLAGYHIAACAEVVDIDAAWIDEEERHLGPVGAKGIGELGIVGTAAAIANAVHHATGIRVRDLPIRLDKLLR